MKRINIVGGTGSGKSYFSKRVAERLNLDYIELDALYWQPNWQSSPPEEFKQRLRSALDEATDGWVVDGSYSKLASAIVHERLDVLVYLKIPLYMVIPRLLAREVKRVVTREKLWGTNITSVSSGVKLSRFAILSHKRREQRIKRIVRDDYSFTVKVFTSHRQANKWLADVGAITSN